ncbi:unnamed protein product, partial [Mesorhabditis belari]|uniref:Uncharacterized protein n=1 Tax=Mesorhabditis belari TaxID=2138241 RepID=A0AAF3EBU7_9BILA
MVSIGWIAVIMMLFVYGSKTTDDNTYLRELRNENQNWNTPHPQFRDFRRCRWKLCPHLNQPNPWSFFWR